MAGRGQVHVVVEEFDDRHRAAEARLFGRGAGAVEGAPGVEDRGAHGLPVEAATAVGRERAGVGEQHLGLRRVRREGGPAQHPQVQREVVRGCRAGRQGDHRAQGAAAQQVGADAAAGAAGGGGRGHQEDGDAAFLEAGQRVLDPGQFGLGAGREAVLPAGVVGEFVVAPVALVERRMAEDGVCREGAVRVVAEAVGGGGAHGRHGGLGVEGQAQCGEGGQFGGAVLAVQVLVLDALRVLRGGHRAQQGAGAARRVEDGPGGAREVGHQGGEAGRCERVLARVGVEMPSEQELVRLAGAQLGREVDGAAQQGADGRSWAAVGVSTARLRTRPKRGVRTWSRGAGSSSARRASEAGAQLQPDRGAVVDEQQRAADVDEGGDRALRVAA